MLTWLARRTGPGSCARWAAKAFTMLKISNPQLSNLEIFRLMLAARYAVIPDPKAEDFFDNYWLKYSPKIGLYSFVLALIQVEHSWDSTLAIPQSFRDAVLLELANSGLPA